MEILENKKIEIIEQIGEDGLRKLKFSKFLKLIENQLQDLCIYYNIKQVHQLVQNIFNIPISRPLFYRYCAKNLKKDEKLEPIKKDKKLNVDVSQPKTKGNSEKGKLMIAQTTELKDDGQLKVADKSEFI